MSYTLSRGMKTAISSGNVGKIKSQLIAMIRLDPSMKMFIKNYDEVIKYIDISEEYCEQANEYTTDKKDRWDISYLHYKIGLLKDNFSYQRIMDIINIYREISKEETDIDGLVEYERSFVETKWFSFLICAIVSFAVVLLHKKGIFF